MTTPMSLTSLHRITYQASPGGPPVVWPPSPVVPATLTYETIHTPFEGVADTVAGGEVLDMPTDDICELLAVGIHNACSGSVNFALNGDNAYSVKPGNTVVLELGDGSDDEPVYSVTATTVDTQDGAGGGVYFFAIGRPW